MSVWLCCSCGEFVLRREQHWSMVDPDQAEPVEYLCESCLDRYRASTPEAIVFLDPESHRATLLSETGLRAAHLDAERDRLAA